MKVEDCKPGLAVLYQPSVGPDRPKYRGVVRELPWQLGGGTWVTHLTDMEPAYGNDTGRHGRTHVHAAAVDCLELAPVVPFLPSQVELGAPPLVGTMKNAEAEHMAGLLVRTCQALGDRWQPLEPGQIGATLRADIESKTEPFCSLVRNPFFSPDVHRLVELGFARWTGEAGSSAVEFTEGGLAAIERWVRRG